MKRSPFRWHTSWTGLVLSDTLLIPNTWTLTLDYDIVTDDLYFKDIGMGRLDFMVRERFENSLLLDFNSEWCNTFYNKMSTYMITFPGEPFDSLIAAVIMLKAAAVTKDVFEIQGTSIISKLGYDVENYVPMEDTESLIEGVREENMLAGDPWFLRDDAGFTDIVHYEEGQPIIVSDTERWDAYDLNWNYYHDQEGTEPAHHPKASIPKHRGWTPVIVKGGNDVDGD